MKAILTTAEAANHLDTKIEKVRRWCREGYLPSVKLGREYRISTAALIDWWEEQGGGRLHFFDTNDEPDPESPLFEGLQADDIDDDDATPDPSPEHENDQQNGDLTSDKNNESISSSQNHRRKTSRKIIR